MIRGDSHRRESDGIGRVDTYATRVMCGLVLSLSFLVAAVKIPLGAEVSDVGWYIARSEERLTIEHIEPAQHSHNSDAPVTRLDDGESVNERPASEDPEIADVGSRARASKDLQQDLRRMTGHKVLDYAHQMPEIVGGMGAFYIHIEYPEDAIRDGIEGRLVLSFVVDTDGATSDVEVVESLHPACDSAAVRALRQTRFVPGNQNGEPVQVRMRLPVRFQLLPRPAQAANNQGDA